MIKILNNITKNEKEVLMLKESNDMEDKEDIDWDQVKEEDIMQESEENRIHDDMILQTAEGLSKMHVEDIQRVLETLSSLDIEDMYEEVILTQ